MALKDLFKMTKADRYTADGCEELNKAREADVEDKVYQIGEISQKTGLQKTANGWVKPKSGKQQAAKVERTETTPAESKPAEGMPGRDFPALKKEDYVKLAKEVLSNTSATDPGWTTEEIAKEWKLGEADAEEVKKEFDNLRKGSSGNNLPDIPDFKGMESGDYDKKLRAEGWTTGGWEGSGTHASAIFKKGNKTIRVNEGKPGTITSVEEITTDAAPRVLTGDTRIRVRK